jgi:hypothetical protein
MRGGGFPMFIAGADVATNRVAICGKARNDERQMTKESQ